MAVARAGGNAAWSVLSGIATMAAGIAATTATATTGMTGRTEGARSGSEHRFAEFGPARAFSSEVDTGSRQENASKQESRAPFRFHRNGKGSRGGSR